MNLQNLRIGTKLAVAFAVTTLLTIALALLAWTQLRDMNAVTTDISGNWLPSVQAVGDIRVATNRLRRTESEVFLPQQAETGAKYRDELMKRRAILLSAEKVYEPLITPGAEQQGYDNYKVLRQKYLEIQSRLLALPDSSREDAQKEFLGESEQVFDQVSQELGDLTSINRKGSDAAQAGAVSTFSRAQITLLAVALVSVAVAIGLALWITRLITRPIAQAVGVARGVAAGNLTMDIVAVGRDESAQLMQALGEMRDSLSAVVGDVRTNAEGVATASAEIAQGNHDLSGRTEQQASALEETAASMEQLSSTVRQNAENAQQASKMAADASLVARRSGDAVGAMVGTMKTIEDASRSIAEIVGVIDGIAFQTNILALNAAVEAARAGEQGRGFAVVASEVRSLAKRSADAAKEIKTLIETSVTRIGEGSTQADRAGESMKEVVGSIERVASIVSEITTASHEQSAGITQVGEAITQMDQVTQQNAALVEESAAAAASLKSQAELLVSAVSVFQLVGTAVARFQAAPAAPKRAAPLPLPSKPAPRFTAPKAAAPTVRKEAPKLVTAGTASDDDWASF